MKIKLSHLRELIRESIEQEAHVAQQNELFERLTGEWMKKTSFVPPTGERWPHGAAEELHAFLFIQGVIKPSSVPAPLKARLLSEYLQRVTGWEHDEMYHATRDKTLAAIQGMKSKNARDEAR